MTRLLPPAAALLSAVLSSSVGCDKAAVTAAGPDLAPTTTTAPTTAATPKSARPDGYEFVLPTIQVEINGRPFTLEVADDNLERARGLMFRQSMPADCGMIFVWDTTSPRAFYMKNTRIPIDIVFLDAQGRVVDIREMRPLDLSSVPSRSPAQYAVELLQGTVGQIGLKVGDRIALPPLREVKKPGFDQNKEEEFFQ